MEANTGVDGSATNVRMRTNMFEEEQMLTDKEKMRKKLTTDKDAMKDAIKAMTPEDVFILFDQDDSGLICFDEFRQMLPFLDVKIKDAKALRYFRMCDTDGSGEIDIDEFKVALFLCDPTNGNPVGFMPSSYLTPLDAFETFDEDRSGFLDEDEFFYALEYLSIPLDDGVAEVIFSDLDHNLTGSIDFDEFREAFLRVVDLRQQLELRGVDVPSFTGKKKMKKMLYNILIEEEAKERTAIGESQRYKGWVIECRKKRKVLQQAMFRAYQELRSALDYGGHVYVFGGGTYNQFDKDTINKLQSSAYEFQYFDKILDLWKDRVRPQQLLDRLRLQRKTEEQEAKRDAERDLGGLGKLGSLMQKRVIIDPYIEAQSSPFHGVFASLNTCALWGRRVHHVAISENVMFALTDTGEVYTWGGNSYWWHEIQPDSLYQKKWRGDTTPRSQLLLGTIDKQIPMDVSMDYNAVDKLSPEDKRAEVIKVVTKYFNCWEPPTNSATRMQYLEKELLPKVGYDDVKFSLKCRGKDRTESTKMQMCEELYGDILLEKKLLGERAHKSIRELETQVAGLVKRRKDKLAAKVMKKIIDMWAPLREVQAEQQAADIAKKMADEHYEALKLETSYVDWRHRVVEKREDLQPQLTPRGNSLQLSLSGITPRGPSLATPRGFQAGIQLAAGSAHACLVHKTGQLYTWGTGASGRLGLDLTEFGDPQKDVVQPRLVQALSGRPVLRVSCGFSHTGAITAGGELFMWGNPAYGKCGLGRIVDKEECYCAVPTKVLVGVDDKRIRKLSCGAAHSAVVTEAGQLFVFGCGDGGRLGLGLNRYGTIHVPVLVESLLHERISSVSCGNTTTIACTEVRHEWMGAEGQKYRSIGGGRVYMAGSKIVLGKQCDSFVLVHGMEGKAVKLASAGYQHSCLVTAEGELYCWGKNKGGCCGVTPSLLFLDSPTLVESLFTLPQVISEGARAYASSTYDNHNPSIAVNGDTDGNGIDKCAVTHQDSQAWIEIDLGKLAVVEIIKIWNRTDVPKDSFLPRDHFTSRLFPCWVMVGQDPFETECSGFSLKNNLRKAVAKCRFADDQRICQWRLPANSQIKYVRVQIEGFNTLNVAEIQVLGTFGICKGAGRISHAAAGRDVTAAVVRPSTDPKDVELQYKRAAYADAMNADILRQLETYALEYDKFGRGDVLMKECSICKGLDKCETCILYQHYVKDIESMVPAVGGRRRRLLSIDEHLLHGDRGELIIAEVPKKVRPSKWDLRWKAFIRAFSWKKKKPKKSHVELTPEEALNMDPEELLASIIAKQDAGVSHESKLNLVFNKAKEKKAEITADKERVDNTEFSRFRKGKTHQADDPGRKLIAAGDVLATGHVVKTPYLQVMTRQADESFEIVNLMKEKAAKEKADSRP